MPSSVSKNDRENKFKSPKFIDKDQPTCQEMCQFSNNEIWPNVSIPLSMNYSFILPSSPDAMADYIKALDHLELSHLELYPISSGSLQFLAKKAMAAWEDVAHISFVENDQNVDLNFAVFNHKTFLSHLFETTRGVANCFAYPKKLAALNEVWMRQAGEYEKLHVLVHELGHVLELDHFFRPAYRGRRMALIEGPSVMKSSYYQENIIAVGPMPYEILFVQCRYGVNTHTNRGNNTYHLTNYSWNTTQYETVQAIWDAGGVDAISAEGVSENALIDLRAGPMAYSKIGKTRVSIAFNVEIENAIGGNAKNHIILNSVNNVVDVRKAEDITTIETDPFHSGHDVILGFKSNQDKIILQGECPDAWNMVYLNDEPVSSQIQFNANNSLTLMNVSHLPASAIGCVPGYVGIVAGLMFELPALISEPSVTLSHALISGMAYTFATQMTAHTLKDGRLSPNKIETLNQCMHSCIAYFNGSLLTSGVSCAAYYLSKLKLSEQTSRRISTTAAITASIAPLSTSLSVSELAVAAVGSYAGAYIVEKIGQKPILGLGRLLNRLGMWSSTRVSTLCGSQLDQYKPHHYKV